MDAALEAFAGLFNATLTTANKQANENSGKGKIHTQRRREKKMSLPKTAADV